ncbi:tail length tape measure protein, partial [Bacillus wiedmannii]
VAWAVAAALAGLAVGISYAYKNVEPFRKAVNNLGKAIKGFAQLIFGDPIKGQDLLYSIGIGDDTIQLINKHVDMIKKPFIQLSSIIKGFSAGLRGNTDAAMEIMKATGISEETATKIANAGDKVRHNLNATGMLLKAFVQEEKKQGSADVDLLRA